MSANPYDPVTTTDSTQLADDDWGLQLPPLEYKRFSGTSRLKTVCFEVKKHPKCLLISGIVISLVVLLTIIISVASHGHSNHRRPTGNEPKWRKTNQGLEYYPKPQDGTIVVSFNPASFYKTADQPIETQLNAKITPYKAVSQLDEPFTDCNATHSPADKVCRIPSSSFGQECTSNKHYGYYAGQPCILAQLVLPEGVKIAPITKDSPLWNVEAAAAHQGINYDPDNVAITCQGATKKDNELLKPFPKQQPFEYYPSKGFPAYIYRPRAASLPHLRPAVMVRLTSLLDGQLVHINCTAWGQLYDFTGKLLSHMLLSAEFAVYIDR